LGGRDGKVRSDLLTYPRRRTWNASGGTSSPDARPGLADQLRTAGITLTYDPDTGTIRTGDSSIAAITVGRDR